jgi:hypothetical protein
MWQDALLLEVNELWVALELVNDDTQLPPVWVALDVINDEALLLPGIQKLLDTLFSTSIWISGVRRGG